MKEWEKLAETPWKRKYTFLPTRHASLRAVPAYPRFVRERFLRCLDLYLAPRAIKMRVSATLYITALCMSVGVCFYLETWYLSSCPI